MKFVWFLTFLAILIGVPLFLSHLPRETPLSPVPTIVVSPSPTPIILTTDNAQTVLTSFDKNLDQTIHRIDADIITSASVSAVLPIGL